MAGVAGVEVADGEGGVQRLLHVTVFEAVLLVGALGPRAGVAVGLELERHRRKLLPVLLEQAELVLDLVGVLVGDDVGDREVADRSPVPLRAAGQRLVERAVVDVGRELLRDVDRVVARRSTPRRCRRACRPRRRTRSPPSGRPGSTRS